MNENSLYMTKVLEQKHYWVIFQQKIMGILKAREL